MLNDIEITDVGEEDAAYWVAEFHGVVIAKGNDKVKVQHQAAQANFIKVPLKNGSIRSVSFTNGTERHCAIDNRGVRPFVSFCSTFKEAQAILI